MVDGRLVIVDAPCSGVQMVRPGYFTACAVALWARRGDRAFLRRLPAVGLLVLAGNIVRNSVPIAFEGAGHALAPWAHNAPGLALLAVRARRHRAPDACRRAWRRASTSNARCRA